MMNNNELFYTILKFSVKIIVLFTALPVHECAHAFAADKLGDPTPRNQGRLTLNPFAHLTLWGSIMLILAGFGWGKPVQVDPNNFKHIRRDNAIVALAGPLSNLIMAYISMIIYKILLFNSMKETDITYYAAIIFYLAMIVNISLAVFNFLPIPPLDGSKIFGAILPENIYFGIMRYEQYIIVAVIVLLYTGLLDVPLSVARTAVTNVFDFLTRWVDLILLGTGAGA